MIDLSRIISPSIIVKYIHEKSVIIVSRGRMGSIFIIGHRKPDTDSICSAIGYAELLNRKNGGGYIPARCGEINAETGFALNEFSAGEPVFIESMEPNVSDLPFTYPVHADEDTPIIEAVSMMDEHGVRNVPVVDHEGRLRGLLSEHGLARTYINKKSIESLSLSPIKVEAIARILNGSVVVKGRHEMLEGSVYMAIDALHVSLSRLGENDVAIVGDNEPAQLALISAGIAALIIAEGAPVGQRVTEEAVKKEITIISTDLQAFGVGKMINLSLPVKMVMNSDVPRVSGMDTIDYVKGIVTNSRYRTACIVGEGDHLEGMISRNTFVEEVQKQVILVDHNEFSQAVDGIETAEILEIIDHHRIGAISTLKPISFLNEPVGSTSTIIGKKFMDSGEDPTPSTAGLLLSGLLSDTLALRMSTTTPDDERVADYLAGVAGVEIDDYGTRLVRAGMEVEGIPVRTLLMRDLKQYDLFGRRVEISQVMIPSFDYTATHGEEIRNELDLHRAGSGSSIFVALFTNVFENASILFVSGDTPTLSYLGWVDQPLSMEGVMSRKKDFLPRFGEMLRNI